MLNPDKTDDLVLFTIRNALPLMPDGGSVILNASIAASKGIGDLSVSSATKAAVRSFAGTWTVDLKDRRIRVNALSPGYIDTAPWRSDSVAEIRANICPPALFRQVDSEHPMRSRRSRYFSPVTIAATLRERNCSSTAVSRKSNLYETSK